MWCHSVSKFLLKGEICNHVSSNMLANKKPLTFHSVLKVLCCSKLFPALFFLDVRLLSILKCKPLHILRHRDEIQIEPFNIGFPPKFLRRIAGAAELQPATRMIRGLGNVSFSTHSQTFDASDTLVLQVDAWCK